VKSTGFVDIEEGFCLSRAFGKLRRKSIIKDVKRTRFLEDDSPLLAESTEIVRKLFA
jgi:hypothetical protein